MNGRYKKMRTASLCLATMVAASMTCSASILIDYDDGNAGNGIHDAAVRNGGFEASTFWAATGESVVDYRDNLNSPTGGGDNVVVGRKNDTDFNGETIHVGQDTGHTLALGDQFSGSFAWRDAFGWDTGETIDMFLYYTADDTIGGVRTVLATLNSGNETANNTWETETLALTTALSDGGAVGKKLFVSFEGNGVSVNSFARLDNVTLEVIPEPGTLGLVSAFGGVILFFRRKFMI